MTARRSLALALALLAVFGLVGARPAAVRAQDAEAEGREGGLAVSRVFQSDPNGDGAITLTTIETNFAGGADRVFVFDGGADMQRSEDWRVATDFENDVWVFDANGDGRAELIVQFVRNDPTSVEARLFDDADGDGQVAYHVSAGSGLPVITESRFPRLTVTSWSTWSRPDGGLVYNLRFAQDGAYLAQDGAQELIEAMRRDGRPDAESIFADENGDGIPEYRISRLLLPTAESSGHHRTGIQANIGQVRPRENVAAIFWPLLGRALSDRGGNYFDTAPTIDVDWTTARIRDAGLVGYPIEQGFHVNALNYLLPGVRTVPDFENTMAYYDLDRDQDHRPELFIRHRYYEAGDRHGENVVPASNEIRYSWTDRNPSGLSWDYKLGLAGRHLITDTVRIGGFDIGMVPWERLPSWVTERTWDMATFVAREGPGYASSEGIYEWAPIEQKGSGFVHLDALEEGEQFKYAIPYIRGSVSIPPRGKFSAMRPGFRGEYSFDYGIRPLLYVSPVDRRAHLLRGERGIWQVGLSTAVLYADGDRDGWLDAWTYVRVDAEGQIVESRELHVLAGYLIYSDGEQIVLRRANPPKSVYDAVAPTTGAEARALRSAIEAQGPPPGPGDLRAMQQQFDGPEQRIANARLSAFRPLAGGGFRFVMETGPAATREGNGPLRAADVRPGRWVVSATDDGVFSVEPLTEPSFTLDARTEGEGGAPLAADASGLVRIALTNVGTRDATGLRIYVDRTSSQGVTTQLAEASGDALAGEPLQIAVPWPPARSGRWTLDVRVENRDGAAVAQASSELALRLPGSVAGLINMALPSTETLVPTLAPLAILAAALGLVVALALRSGDGRRVDP